MSDRLDGAIRLPGDVLVRGRGLRNPLPDGLPPAYGLYLGGARLRGRHDAALAWPHDWLDWPDFWLPRDRETAAGAIRGLHVRARDGEAAEVACGGGVGRTGTVLACLATLGGLPAGQAVAWVREHHHPRAVETPWQRRWVAWFAVQDRDRLS